MDASALVNEEVRKRGLRHCQEFLGGAWTKATLDQFQMEHIRGGLSNLLYSCRLSDKLATVGDEPRCVLLRIYGQIIHENPETVLTDSVIFALLAEKGMGPKLHGVFTGGRVEEFVPSRHLYTDELHDPEISVACARMMAHFHQLKMPLVKQPKWLFDTMTRYLDEALNNVTFGGNNSNIGNQEKLQQLLSFGLASELQSLRDLLSQVHSPIVFCHNDLQEGNILYVETENGWHIRPIDFEYASYSYRGFDIGNHFCEWCYCYKCDEPPYFIANLDNYPNREEQLRFIRAYLEIDSDGVSHLGNGFGDCNGVTKQTELEESMLLEANVYALASHFMWGLWAIVQSHISKIQFGYLEYAHARFDAYFKQKKELVKQLPDHQACSS